MRSGPAYSALAVSGTGTSTSARRGRVLGRRAGLLSYFFELGFLRGRVKDTSARPAPVRGGECTLVLTHRRSSFRFHSNREGDRCGLELEFAHEPHLVDVEKLLQKKAVDLRHEFNVPVLPGDLHGTPKKIHHRGQI